MCRLILARGVFRADDIVDGALDMCAGRTADHEEPTPNHYDGWGAVWRVPDSANGLGFHRDVRSMVDGVQESPVRSVRSDFLAIHARHASLAYNQGARFVHPLDRQEPGFTWYFMHNGFLPTVYKRLGLPESTFDSAEYFEYIVPKGTRRMDREETLVRLEAVPPGGLSGNAIAVNDKYAYVMHRLYEPNPYPRYFQMYQLVNPDALIIASEVIPRLAPANEWEPMKPDQVLEVSLDSDWR